MHHYRTIATTVDFCGTANYAATGSHGNDMLAHGPTVEHVIGKGARIFQRQRDGYYMELVRDHELELAHSVVAIYDNIPTDAGALAAQAVRGWIMAHTIASGDVQPLRNALLSAARYLRT